MDKKNCKFPVTEHREAKMFPDKKVTILKIQIYTDITFSEMRKNA